VLTKDEIDAAIGSCLKAMTTVTDGIPNATSSNAARDNAETAERLAEAIATLIPFREAI
jgi:hypothetical protein